MKDHYIDINVDVGEGLHNESQLMPYLSSCNIACGGHAGSEDTIKNCMQLAKEHNVAIGAHPSYPDSENFGRKVMHITLPSLQSSLLDQLSLFFKIAEEEKVHVQHVKPHRALYNEAARNPIIAEMLLEVFEKTGKTFQIFAPWKSQLAQTAEKKNWKVLYEAFADRAYNYDLSLVSRQHENAILETPEACLKQICGLTFNNEITTVGGITKPLQADTICIHGDHPQVKEILPYLKTELLKRNIFIKKYKFE